MPAKDERQDKWSRSITYDQSAERESYAVNRLINQAGAAEGSNLPPRIISGIRVQPPTNFKVSRQEELKYCSRFILSWINNHEMERLGARYRIYTYAQQNVMPMSSTQQISSPTWTGPLLADVLADASPAEVVVRGFRRQPVVFSIETRLPNGLISTEESRATCTGVCDPKWNFVRQVAANYTCVLDDETIFVDTTAAGYTITLFDITQLPEGFEYVIRNINGANNVTVQGANASQTIDGAASITVGAGTWQRLRPGQPSISTVWYKV